MRGRELRTVARRSGRGRFERTGGFIISSSQFISNTLGGGWGLFMASFKEQKNESECIKPHDTTDRPGRLHGLGLRLGVRLRGRRGRAERAAVSVGFQGERRVGHRPGGPGVEVQLSPPERQDEAGKRINPRAAFGEGAEASRVEDRMPGILSSTLLFNPWLLFFRGPMAQAVTPTDRRYPPPGARRRFGR